MSTSSTSPAEAGDVRSILVWDAPVRVFHWLMVASFAGAYFTAESDRWQLVHVTLGYTMAGLVVFRILWGVMGSRYARFASFVRGPGEVMRYVRAMLGGTPERHVGHNPLGALAIVALLALTLAVAVSGWATWSEVDGRALEELHEGLANGMLAVVAIHVAGVLLTGWLHGENLVAAMISGRKSGRPADGVRAAWRGVAALMMVAVIGFWVSQWSADTVLGGPDGRGGIATKAGHGDHDDDD